MNEIEFHKERIRLTPMLIEYARLETEYWDLYLKINPEGNLHVTDLMLEARNFNSKQIEFFSKEFAVSEEFLEQRGIEPFPSFKNEFHVPYRSHVTAWIRKYLKNIFIKPAIQNINNGRKKSLKTL